MLAVVCSIVVPPLLFQYGLIEFETAADRLVRIAIASGAAFLTAQLLDVTVFNRLRRRSWWRAPVFGSLAGSVLDTAIFFCVAFAAALRLRRPERRLRAGAAHRCFGVLPVETARWMSWAVGRSHGEAADRGLRADPLPADRRDNGRSRRVAVSSCPTWFELPSASEATGGFLVGRAARPRPCSMNSR